MRRKIGLSFAHTNAKKPNPPTAAARQGAPPTARFDVANPTPASSSGVGHQGVGVA